MLVYRKITEPEIGQRQKAKQPVEINIKKNIIIKKCTLQKTCYMKKTIFLLFISAIACTGTTKKETPVMPGTYIMLSQSVKGGATDTTYKTLKQMKIYTEDYFMYANVNPADSVSAFGIGTYSADTGVVTEHSIFSAADSTRSTSAASFNLQVEKTGKGYRQVIPDIESHGQKYMLTEEYQAEDTAAKSSLDGAWKQIKYYYIKGKDTSAKGPIQYKTYYQGHFIWGNSYTDSAKKTYTGIGFGTFIMDGTDKVKETIMASTYSQINGMVFNIDLAMNGSDEFSQTITNSDSSKTIEVYQRLKK